MLKVGREKFAYYYYYYYFNLLFSSHFYTFFSCFTINENRQLNILSIHALFCSVLKIKLFFTVKKRLHLELLIRLHTKTVKF